MKILTFIFSIILSTASFASEGWTSEYNCTSINVADSIEMVIRENYREDGSLIDATMSFNSQDLLPTEVQSRVSEIDPNFTVTTWKPLALDYFVNGYFEMYSTRRNFQAELISIDNKFEKIIFSCYF